MAQAFEVEIIENRPVARDHVELIVKSTELAKAEPGQFCHVLTPGLLRRPISFSRINPVTHEVGILLQVVGRGTAFMAAKTAHERLNVLGPLGRGFAAPESHRPWLLVGGGVGIPPVYAALERYQEEHEGPTMAILGARSRDYLIMQQDFETCGVTPLVTTDDGSLGQPGTVLAPVMQWMQRFPDGEIMACGPTPMLKAISEAAEDHSGRVQLALEQRMGCGIGACLACVVPAQPIDEAGPRYRRVCTDGPVFLKEELAL